MYLGLVATTTPALLHETLRTVNRPCRNATAAETVSLGLVANNSFSVSGVDEGGLFSVFGRYLSWQCGDEPGELQGC